MFIGHFAVAFAAKPLVRPVSLGTLFIAAQFIDLLWPSLLLLGIERVEIKTGGYHGPPLAFVHYPVSHSLVAVIGWAVLLGALHFGLRRDRRAALVLGLAVLSHWMLDLLVHEPDLALAPGATPRVGLGLWWWPVPSLVFEIALFAAGVALYLRATRALDRTGTWSLWALVGFLLVIQLANSFGPPPPSVEAVAWAGQAQWLLVLWGYWVDRHRANTA
jgi:uncharacterized membrane protein YhaH (DUF805 family)